MGRKSVGRREEAQMAVLGNIAGLDEMLSVRLSFETGEQGAVKIRMPFRARIVQLRSQVVLVIADTDAATVTPSNSVGNMADGTISHALDAALGDEDVATPTTNTTIDKDTDLTLTPAKTTAGGKVNVTVQYVRLA